MASFWWLQHTPPISLLWNRPVSLQNAVQMSCSIIIMRITKVQYEGSPLTWQWRGKVYYEQKGLVIISCGSCKIVTCVQIAKVECEARLWRLRYHSEVFSSVQCLARGHSPGLALPYRTRLAIPYRTRLALTEQG